MVAPCQSGREDLFAVAWKCPGCLAQFLVMSPVGPLGAPGATTCLQCGHDGTGDTQPCPSCGNVLSQVLSDAELARPDRQQLDDARQAFARGTCRRGLTLVNLVLRRNPRSEEAWKIKAKLMEHLGFKNVYAAVIAEAERRCREQDTRDKPWWQFWK